MPRPIWTGSITFGLVNVPVRLFSAVSQKEVRFHMLHKKDGGRIRMKRVCSIDGKEIPYEEIEKGFEIAPEQYVEILPEELEKFDPKASKSIDIEDFVSADEIDPIYFDHPYFVAPDKSAEKAYALLTESMREQNKVAVARMVMRTKQYLCVLRPYEDGLSLTTLNYADEVNDIGELDLPDEHAKPKERELKMAEQLINTLTAKKWDPDKYRDEYRDKVMALIEQKAAGEKVTPISEAPHATKTVDLMEALQASLAMGRGEAANESTGHHKGEIRHRAAAAKTARASSSHKKAAHKKKPAHKKK
ncbi:MAG: Ku protein [Myxococcaceae bacterium]